MEFLKLSGFVFFLCAAIACGGAVGFGLLGGGLYCLSEYGVNNIATAEKGE